MKIVSSADISDCGFYRYSLLRQWNSYERTIVFVGLNPSTADGKEDDPTIRRCVRFAKDNGHGALIMVNLFAFRSTDQKQLQRVDDPVGPENDIKLRHFCCLNRTVFAWGREHSALIRRRSIEVRGMLHPPFSCLGKNGDGSPKHPLYLPAETKLEQYP